MPETKKYLDATTVAPTIWPVLNGRFFPGSDESLRMNLQDITFSDDAEIGKVEKQEHGKWGNVIVQRSIVCVVQDQREQIREILLTKRGNGHKVTTSKSLLISGDPTLPPEQILQNKVDIGEEISGVSFSPLGYGFSGSIGIYYYFEIFRAVLPSVPKEILSRIAKDTVEFRPTEEVLAAIGQKKLEINIFQHLMNPRTRNGTSD